MRLARRRSALCGELYRLPCVIVCTLRPSHRWRVLVLSPVSPVSPLALVAEPALLSSMGIVGLDVHSALHIHVRICPIDYNYKVNVYAYSLC